MSYPFPDDAQKIIIAPLNWGLGHATRCFPIIQDCLKQNKKLIIVSDGEALAFLQKSFPQCQFENIPGYNVTYKSQNITSIAMSNFWNVLRGILNDRKCIKALVKKYNPDFILSDSRFGFWHSTVNNAIISHQLTFQSSVRWLSTIINLFNTFFINRFNSCWVPDSKDHEYAGQLSQNDRVNNKKYIGLLSDLEQISLVDKKGTAIVLSGPEPARTHLENKLITLLSGKSNITLVRGTNKSTENTYPNSWTVHDLLDRNSMSQIYQSAKQIVCRSGYSSLMDLNKLGLKAILIPTPGQTEQEYLATLYNEKGFKTLHQNQLHKLSYILD